MTRTLTRTARAGCAMLACLPLCVLAACDSDGDGVRNRRDCAPRESAAYGGAAEICDSIDNDCDGVVDESDDGAGAWGFVDRDGDGHAGARVFLCARYLESLTNLDCHEYDPAIFVGQTEVCNGIDDDCDGFVDVDISGLALYWPDRDGDGYGDAAGLPACAPQAGLSARAGDCDDANPTASPAAAERCDDVDNDCNGVIDDVAGGC